jgi:predicted secreted protein
MKTLLWVLALGLAVVGCATKSTYYNPYIDDPIAVKRQFTVDDGGCTRVAAGSIPIPEVRMYSPDTQSYNFSGTANTYNSTTGNSTTQYQGTAYPSGGGFAGGFSSGFASGMSIGAAIRARKEREKVYHGCMVSLGWTDDQKEMEALKATYKSEQQKAEKQRGTDQDIEVQMAIDSIPELSQWQKEDSSKWVLAVDIDQRIRELPEFKDMPLRQRFLKVVALVNGNSEFSSSVKPLSIEQSNSEPAYRAANEPKVHIKMPDTIEEGSMVPINVDIESDSKFKSVALFIKGNRLDYSIAYDINFDIPQTSAFISSRIRMEAKGVSPIHVSVIMDSGKIVNKTFDSGEVIKPADFDNLAALNVLSNRNIFHTDEIGQVKLVSKLDSNGLDMKSIMHHPNLLDNFIYKIIFRADGRTIATVKSMPGLSNDPFMQIRIPGQKYRTTNVFWYDAYENVYTASKDL